LPELYRFWIGERRESVIEDYLGDGWRMLVHELILSQRNCLEKCERGAGTFTPVH
jgi:hypothetical protein